MERPTADLPVILSLAHLNMFGESYGSQVDQLLENFKRACFGKIYQKHEVSYYECDINQTMTFPSMLGVVIKRLKIKATSWEEAVNSSIALDLLGSSRIIPWRLIVSLESVK